MLGGLSFLSGFINISQTKFQFPPPIPSFPAHTFFTSHIFTRANQNYEYAKNEKRSEQIVKAIFQFFTVHRSRI